MHSPLCGGASFQIFTVGFHSLVAENARGIQSLNDGAADGAAIFPLLRPVLTGWKKWGGARRSYERQKKIA